MDNLVYGFNGDERTELLDGRIVKIPTQRTRHHIVTCNIFSMLKESLKGQPYKPFSGGADVFLTKKDRVVPDVMIVCNRDIIKSHGIHGVPDLIVEVLSPSTTKRDKGYKKDLYERCGVREYWLVDTVIRSVELYVLRGGRYELEIVCETIPDADLAVMTDEERAEVKYEFSPVIFPEITLTLDEIFEDADF